MREPAHKRRGWHTPNLSFTSRYSLNFVADSFSSQIKLINVQKARGVFCMDFKIDISSGYILGELNDQLGIHNSLVFD